MGEKKDDGPGKGGGSKSNTTTDVAKDTVPDKKEKENSKKEQNILTRTGGAYIPPARLRMMQEAITDKERYTTVL